MMKIIKTTIGLTLLASLAFAPLSHAKNKSKGKGKIISQTKAQKTHLKAIRKKEARVLKLKNRINDFQAVLNVSPGLRTEPGPWNQLNKAKIEHAVASNALNKLTQTTYVEHARARGRTLIPYPPTVAPPQPPKATLRVDYSNVRKNPKSKLPPRKSQ